MSWYLLLNFGDADGCAGLHHPGEERVAFLLRSSVSQHGLASGPWQRWWRRTHCEIARWRLYIIYIYYILYIYYIYMIIPKWLEILSREISNPQKSDEFLHISNFSAMILRTELKPLRCFWHFLLHDSLGRLLLGSFLLVPWRIY